MTDLSPQPLRVELTLLDDKLYQKEVRYVAQPTPHLLYSTLYQDAVSPPFPAEGKIGLSVFVGRREQFRKAEIPLLWQLEKKRGRVRMVVVTNLRGREFLPAFRELEGCLAEPRLAPISFLRRRGKTWDSLDFFSSGWSESIRGAAARLRRLKQYGWEMVVDRLSLADEEIKKTYFETLHVERSTLQEALLRNFQKGEVSLMVGIAGGCLQREHLPLLFAEETNARILASLGAAAVSTPGPETWAYLAKRDSARELLLLGSGERWLRGGEVLVAQGAGETRTSELLVSKVHQRLQMAVGESFYTLCRVGVEWRYKPAREIPVVWQQNSISSAGTTTLDG